MFLTVFTCVLSLLGDPKDKQKVNKTKQCNKSVHQHTFTVRNNVVCVVVFIVLHHLCFVNASTNPQSSVFKIPSTEKAMVTSETQTYNATSDIGRSKRAITDSLKENLKSIFLKNECKDNTELKDLIQTEYSNSPGQFKIFFKEAVSDVFGVSVDTTNLLDCFHYFNREILQLFGYEAMIEKMEKDDSLYKDVFKVANRIRIHLEHDTILRFYSKELKMKLPEVVRLVSFSHKVQIKNLFDKEYLYAASNGFSYDLDRRRVFTWIPKIPVTQGQWLFEYCQPNDCFFIKNIAHNEYLYAAAVLYAYDEDRRGVFTWRSLGSYDFDKFCWKIEFAYSAKDIIQIKNLYYNEYLFADLTYDKDRRRVFTYIPGVCSQQHDVVYQ